MPLYNRAEAYVSQAISVPIHRQCRYFRVGCYIATPTRYLPALCASHSNAAGNCLMALAHLHTNTSFVTTVKKKHTQPYLSPTHTNAHKRDPLPPHQHNPCFEQVCSVVLPYVRLYCSRGRDAGTPFFGNLGGFLEKEFHGVLLAVNSPFFTLTVVWLWLVRPEAGRGCWWCISKPYR